MAINEINILIGNTQEGDRDLFFGPLTDNDKFIEMEKEVRWPEILVNAGIFPSKGQARKNGWDKDIPKGWTDISIGKKKKRFCILNCTTE